VAGPMANEVSGVRTYRVGFRVRIHLEEIMNLAGFHMG
jgi:hypothetical protein